MARIAELCHVRQVDGVAQARPQGRLELSQSCFVERRQRQTLGMPFLGCRFAQRGEELQSAAAQVAVVDAGALAQLGAEGGKNGAAMRAELFDGSACPAQFLWWQNPGAGPRRFLAEVALVNYRHAGAVAREEICGGQADD